MPISPYRAPAARRASPASPDIDPKLLAMQWWQPMLIVSVLSVPPWLALTWLTDMTVRLGGSSHIETVPEKIAFTAAATTWFVVLLWFRARHRRRQRAALASLQADEARESARVRVETPEQPDVSGVSGESDDTVESDERSQLRK